MDNSNIEDFLHGGVGKDPTLDEILNFTEKAKTSINFEEVDFLHLLKESIPDDEIFTISLAYDDAEQTCSLAIQGIVPNVYKRHMTPDEYLELCKIVEVEENNNYNESKSITFANKRVRVFALTRPLANYPIITLSTVKEPPLEWHQIEITKILPTIIKDSFLIVGASGAGKTYFMNYMLKECHKNSKDKIGMVEEFDELYRPNDAVVKIVTPPRKPAEKGLLHFITEQSNLMRLKYLYVGELKGPEALPFITNLASGTKGGATIHGESVAHGLQRLKSLCLMYGEGIPDRVIDETIAKSLHYVIYLENHNVMEVKALTGVSMNGNFALRDVWKNPALAIREKEKEKKTNAQQTQPIDYNSLNEYSQMNNQQRINNGLKPRC